MWKHPSKLFDFLADAFWALLRERNITRVPPGNEVQSAAANLLLPLMEWLAEVKEQGVQGETPAWFRDDLKKRLGTVAQHIEQTSGYSVIPEMWRIISGIAMVDIETAETCNLLANSIQLLVGSETKYLVGLRGGRPAFKQLSPTIKSRENIRTLFKYGPGLDIVYLDRSDAELVPNWQEYGVGWPPLDFPAVEYPTRQLLEDAYYNQRYVVSPLGAYVQLRHLHPLVGLTLKIKPGLTDSNYQDFIVVFDVDVSQASSKSSPRIERFISVFDGAFASGVLPAIGLEQQVTRSHYLIWVVAMIYHDLVTAKNIKGVRTVSDTHSVVVKQGKEKPSWVYIPRKLRGYRHQPREVKENRRAMTPHHVSGHPRRGNLSEAHRSELEKFEAETGLKVLELLERNPGHTFVRPHISPGGETLATLPRFIHARLQADIVAMMSRIGGNGASSS